MVCHSERQAFTNEERTIAGERIPDLAENAKFHHLYVATDTSTDATWALDKVQCGLLPKMTLTPLI